MSKNIAIAILSLTLLAPAIGYSANWNRDSRSGEVFPGKAYLGLKYGVFTTEQTVGSYEVDMDNMGFVFAGDINQYLALEFDYTQTVSADKEEFLGSTAKQTVDTIGLFLVAKTRGKVYARGRLGYTRAEQQIRFMGASESDNIYGMAYGIGAGIKLGKEATLEIEYTVYPDTDEFFGIPVAGEIETEFVSIGIVWSYE
jgi:opacity protein-like surface antigen